MSIQGEIAQHFWKDGENATWQTSPNFPPALLQWLKLHYSELVAPPRSNWVELPEGTVYLFFLDEQDTHGRKATRLTAFWLEEPATDIQEAYRKLASRENFKQSSPLPIRLQVKKASKGRSSILLPIMGVLLLMLVYVSYVFFDAKKEPDVQVVPPRIAITSMQQPEQKQTAIPKKVKVEHKKESSHTKISVCEQYQKMNTRCFHLFITEKCQAKTSLDYQHWLEAMHQQNPTQFTMRSCPSSIEEDADLEQHARQLSPARQKVLKQFLNQKGGA